MQIFLISEVFVCLVIYITKTGLRKACKRTEVSKLWTKRITTSNLGKFHDLTNILSKILQSFIKWAVNVILVDPPLIEWYVIHLKFFSDQALDIHFCF